MNKVYKGRQKLNFEQAGQYYSHAYKIGVEHGKFTERERIIALLENFDDSNLWRQTTQTAYEGFDIADIIELIKEEQK